MSFCSSLWQGFLNKTKLLAGILSLFVVFTMTGCSLISGEQVYSSEEFLMDTFIKIQVYAQDEAKAKAAMGKAFQEFKRVELLSNRFAQKDTTEYERSEIIKINTKATKQPVQISPEMFEMLRLGKEYSSQTDGAFEITIGPVMDLWGFGSERQGIPSEQSLQTKLNLVGSNKIALDEERKTVFLEQDGMSIDLGGIAKGYATEKAAQALRDLGIKRAIINAGGNIYVLGEKAPGAPWKIGIQDPKNSDEIIAVLNLKDQAAVTSGDYQRFFEVDGTRYHHLIDPRTGKPARELLSVTVIATDSTAADILSTSFFILGMEKSLDYIEHHQEIEAVFITPDKRVISTSGLKHLLETEQSGGYRYDQRR